MTFIWSDDLSLPDILGRVASLPSHSAIVYLTFGTDAQGGAYADEPVLADLHAAANAPMFGAFSSLFGHGIVGGSMMSIGGLARNTADVASRILNGEPPASLRVPPQSPGEPIFDWRELQRWGIPESRLAAWQRRAVSWPEPVGRIQARSAGRRRRADSPIAADRLRSCTSAAHGSARRSTAAGTWLSPPTPIDARRSRR